MAPVIIEAACALHNLSLDERLDDEGACTESADSAEYNTATVATATSSVMRETARRKRDPIAAQL